MNYTSSHQHFSKINIFDLVAGRYEKRHQSVAALAKYTIETEQFFPRDKAKNDGLKAFLRVLRGIRGRSTGIA